MYPNGVDGHIGIPDHNSDGAEDDANRGRGGHVKPGDKTERGADGACKHCVAGHRATGCDKANIGKVDGCSKHHALHRSAHNDTDQEAGPNRVEPGSGDHMAEPPGAAGSDQSYQDSAYYHFFSPFLFFLKCVMVSFLHPPQSFIAHPHAQACHAPKYSSGRAAFSRATACSALRTRSSGSCKPRNVPSSSSDIRCFA